jgi:hypothetical protein
MKIINFLSIVLLLIGSISCSSNKTVSGKELRPIPDKEYGEPMLVLIETNPWLEVIGSDSPSFVLYDNGILIYQTVKDGRIRFYHRRYRKHPEFNVIVFNQNELDEFIEYLSIDESLYDLDNEITSSDAYDQPNNILYLDIIKDKTITVYGNINVDNTSRDRTPEPFIELYDKIKNYKNKNSITWIPPKIEVMFWDYNYAPRKRRWLKGFPDLNSPSTSIRRSIYSVFIDTDGYEIFFNYIRRMGERQAVEINGRKMAISYRIPFPNIDK